MKILQINKFFYPHGGTETYLFSLISLLSKNGHQIIGFSQKNKNNINIKGEEFFIDQINLDKFYLKNIFKIGRIFWSFKAKKNIAKLIEQENVDLIHIHNIYHQISPSILPEIKKTGLPIIMTVHDFKLISPNYTLWAVENSKPGKSPLARLLMSLEYLFHRTLKIYQKNIDLFIAPSEFVKNKLITAGFDANKIIVLPHFVEISAPIETKEEKNYIVCFGRLDESKGIDILIKALAEIKSDVVLKIIGTGKYESNLRELAKDLKIENRIEFIPHTDKNTLENIIAQSLFTVFPSLVHETFGLGVIESYLLSKPVIASRVGAYGENVIDGKTGLLVEPKNVIELQNALEKMILSDDLRKAMGQSAKKFAEEKFTALNHLNKITDIYNSLVEKSKNEKIHYELEKRYAREILSAPSGPIRNEIITKAYNNVNLLVNKYKSNGIRGHNHSTFNLIKSLASKNDRILDYGCGGGELVGLLGQNGYNVSGFDVSSSIIEEANKNTGMSYNFISRDLNQINDKYDIIIMDNVIEHIAPDEIESTLKSLKNILNDDGQLLVITPHRFAGPHDISGHFLKLGSKALGLHLKEYDLHELVSDLKKNGYQDIVGYPINPRLTEKINFNLKPSNFWLKKSLIIEKLFSFKILNTVLKLNKNLTRIWVALMFPTIVIAKK